MTNACTLDGYALLIIRLGALEHDCNVFDVNDVGPALDSTNQV